MNVRTKKLKNRKTKKRSVLWLFSSCVFRLRKGQSLVEVLVALGVFVSGISATGFLALDASVATRQGVERTKAVMLAKEGLEATRSMRDTDFDNLTAGPHGIAISGNRWVFSGTSDTIDQFARVVIVTDIDVDTKKVESSVSWQITGARQGSVVLADYLTDWNQSHGDGGNMTLDLTAVNLISPAKNELRRIRIQNAGTGAITIDKMAAWWDNANKLKQIQIDGTNVYGPVSDVLAVPSGTEIDIINFPTASYSGRKEIDKIVFTGDMSGTDFIVKFIMTDGSTKYGLVDL